MAMSQEERAWFDERFDRLYDKMDEGRRIFEDRMNIHSTKINAVTIDAVKSISAHEKDFHDPVKKWGVWASIVALGSGAWALLKGAWDLLKGDK